MINADMISKSSLGIELVILVICLKRDPTSKAMDAQRETE